MQKKIKPFKAKEMDKYDLPEFAENIYLEATGETIVAKDKRDSAGNAVLIANDPTAQAIASCPKHAKDWAIYAYHRFRFSQTGKTKRNKTTNNQKPNENGNKI